MNGIQTIEVLSHEQLKSAAIVIVHAVDMLTPSQKVDMAERFREEIKAKGYDCSLIVSNSLESVEIHNYGVRLSDGQWIQHSDGSIFVGSRRALEAWVEQDKKLWDRGPVTIEELPEPAVIKNNALS